MDEGEVAQAVSLVTRLALENMRLQERIRVLEDQVDKLEAMLTEARSRW